MHNISIMKQNFIGVILAALASNTITMLGRYNPYKEPGLDIVRLMNGFLVLFCTDLYVKQTFL